MQDLQTLTRNHTMPPARPRTPATAPTKGITPNRNAYVEIEYRCPTPNCGTFIVTKVCANLTQICQMCGCLATPQRMVRAGVRAANRWAVEEFNPA